MAVFTFPLRHGDRGLGALDLYRETAGALDEAEMAAAQTLADVATAYLLNARSRADLKAASAMEHEALEKLRLLDQTKTEYLATVIHELRTPMTSITGYTEMLQEGDLDTTQKKLLRGVVRNSDRLTALADDLLTLASLEHATIAHEHTSVDLGEVVTAVLSALQALSDDRELELTFKVPATPVLVHGDARNLERMVSNLVSNAVKFTHVGGWVRVALAAGRWARASGGQRQRHRNPRGRTGQPVHQVLPLLNGAGPGDSGLRARSDHRGVDRPGPQRHGLGGLRPPARHHIPHRPAT